LVCSRMRFVLSQGTKQWLLAGCRMGEKGVGWGWCGVWGGCTARLLQRHGAPALPPAVCSGANPCREVHLQLRWLQAPFATQNKPAVPHAGGCVWGGGGGWGWCGRQRLRPCPAAASASEVWRLRAAGAGRVAGVQARRKGGQRWRRERCLQVCSVRGKSVVVVGSCGSQPCASVRARAVCRCA